VMSMKLLLASASLAVVLTSAAYAQIPSSLQACPAGTQYTMAGAKPAEGEGATRGPQLASADESGGNGRKEASAGEGATHGPQLASADESGGNGRKEASADEGATHGPQLASADESGGNGRPGAIIG
jgi:hypothetical protein